MSEQILNRVMEIVGWGSGGSRRSSASRGSSGERPLSREARFQTGDQDELIEALRELLETELGCNHFAVFNVDAAKGVLWPMLHSSDEAILRPIDVMSNLSIQRVLNNGANVMFRLPVHLEEFLPAVSAFVPLTRDGQVHRFLMLFDLKRSSFELLERNEPVLDVLKDHVEELLTSLCRRSGSVTTGAF